MSAASDKYRFIFVRVPRTGSSTFMHYLETTLTDLIDVGEQHSSAIELKDLWGKKWCEYHTFGFIRNPWEWLVSMYNANLSNGAWGKETLPGGSKISEFERSNMPFDEWVMSRETTPISWLSDKNGNILVDEIRLFEDLIKNAKYMCSNLPHSRYQEWYSKELVEYVAEKCKKEIEIGNYEF